MFLILLLDALCEELEPIPSGEIDLNATTMQSMVAYTCDDGFLLRGDRVRFCRADKKWHPKAPVCQRKYTDKNKRMGLSDQHVRKCILPLTRDILGADD